MNRYAAIIHRMIEGIQSIVPADMSDYRFECAEDGRGGILAPRDWIKDPLRRTREFDIRALEHPSPGPGCNVLAKVGVRLAYRLDTDLGYLDTIIAEDVRSIISALVFNTFWWGSLANSVYMEDGDVPSSEIVSDNNDNPSTVVVSVPLVLDYRTKE
jgi:hypothetical protein